MTEDEQPVPTPQGFTLFARVLAVSFMLLIFALLAAPLVWVLRQVWEWALS